MAYNESFISYFYKLSYRQPLKWTLYYSKSLFLYWSDGAEIYLYSITFRGFLLPENCSKNSILNWVLKLSLDQQTFWNTTNMIVSHSFQCLDLLVIQKKFLMVIHKNSLNKCESRWLLPTWILIARKLCLPL